MFKLPDGAVEGYFIGPDLQVRAFITGANPVPCEFYTRTPIKGAGKFYAVGGYEATLVANMSGKERLAWAQERSAKRVDGRHNPRRRQVAA